LPPTKRTASAPKAAKSAKAAPKPASKKTASKKTAAKLPRKGVPKAVPTGAVPSAPPIWLTAVQAADSKKATGIRVLDLRPITSFADFFVICQGSNQRQIQAVCDEVESALKLQGERAISVEGYGNAEWILMDYGDLVVHIFSDQARAYYDLDRLWREALEVELPADIEGRARRA
jgi:ribosome-associated protein